MGRLGLAFPGRVELAHVAGHQGRLGVGHGAVRRAGRSRGEGGRGRDLEAFADIHPLLPAAGQVEHVLRYRLTKPTALVQLRFEQRVGEQHPLRRLADRNEDAAAVRRGRNERVASQSPGQTADHEGQATERPETRFHVGCGAAENLWAGIA